MKVLSLTALFALVAILMLDFSCDVQAASWRRRANRFNSDGSSSESNDSDEDFSFGRGNSVLSRINRYLLFLQNRIRQLEMRGCQSGFLNFTICDDANGTTLVVGNCTTAQLLTGNVTMIMRQVSFNIPFRKTPAVVAGLTGVSFLGGQDASVDVQDVTASNFNIMVTLEGILPFEVRLSWFACNEARMD